jgi:hypothetical protein
MGGIVARFCVCFILGLLPGVVSPAVGSAGTSLLRLVHASPNAPALEVYLDGQRAATALNFADATTYFSVPDGKHEVRVQSTGAGAGAPVLINTQFEFLSGLAYTLVAADLVDRLDPLLLTDELAVPDPGMSYIRVVHASPDAPPVADIAVAGGPVAYRGLPFKGASPYLPIAPGTYAFEIRPANTPQAVATTPPLTLEPGRIYSAIAIGQFGDGTFQALALPDNANTGGVGVTPSAGGGGMARSRAHIPAVAQAIGVIALFAASGAWRLRTRRHTRPGQVSR